MAEFLEVLKQKERMCNSYEGCKECPIYESTCMNICDWIIEYSQEAEEIIMKWAKEHPIQTNADKFKEVFGFIPPVSCPKIYADECDNKSCYECKDKDFWDKEYKAPTEEVSR